MSGSSFCGSDIVHGADPATTRPQGWARIPTAGTKILNPSRHGRNQGVSMAALASLTLSRRGFLALLAGAPFAPALGAPARYTFTLIADTSGALEHFDLWYSLNNRGMVVFSAGLRSGEAGVFAGDGGPLRQIASSKERFSSFGGPYGGYVPTLNDVGTVVLYADPQTGGSGLYLSDGERLTPIAETTQTFAYGQVLSFL
jgi:hypothetical protein